MPTFDDWKTRSPEDDEYRGRLWPAGRDDDDEEEYEEPEPMTDEDWDHAFFAAQAALTALEGPPDPDGQLDHECSMAIIDQIRRRGFDGAREFVAEIFNREAEGKR